MNNCIYIIETTVNDKIYVGRTMYFDKRIKRHLSELRRKVHHNVRMQNDYDKYGEEIFIWKVIKEGLTLEEAIEWEQYYIDSMKEKLYNINMSSTFGDAISNHPNKKDIAKRIGESVKKHADSMSQEEKHKRYAHTKGEGNPNYKNRGINSPLYGVKKPEGFGEKISKALKGRKLNENQKKALRENGFKKGDTPWNKGKTGLQKWTKEQHEKRSKGLPQNRKKVYCEGKIYDSLGNAAKAYNITPGAMNYRINSDKEKFKDFYYIKK